MLKDLVARRAYQQAYRKRNAVAARERTAAWRLRNPEKQREMVRRYRKNNPEKRRAWELKYRRRISGLPDPTRPMPTICESCGRPPGKRSLHLDHNHATGKFRGWLCSLCNCGIGSLGDTLEGLERACKYLKANE